MSELTRSLIVLGFVFLTLLALLLVNPNFESSRSLLADSQSTVSELGLRFSFQR